MSKTRSRARTIRKSTVGLDQLGSYSRADNFVCSIIDIRRDLAAFRGRAVTLRERQNQSVAKTKKRKPSLPVFNLPPAVE